MTHYWGRRRGIQVMAHGDARNDPCACGSGRKAKRCCLVDGHWVKQPVRVLPESPATGHSNPSCYLARFRDCSTKISREHYFSSGILSLISEEIGGNIAATGLAWVERAPQDAVPADAFNAKVLCDRHNSGLGPLDDAATKLYRAICDLHLGWPDTAGRFLMSGHDLERWMLKVTIGILLTGQHQVKPDLLVKFDNISDKTLGQLLHPGRFDYRAGEGLYAVRTEAGGFIRSPTSGFTTHWADNQTLAGVTVELRGLRFVLSLSPEMRIHPDYSSMTHRPERMAFSKKGGKRRNLMFSWVR